MTKSAWVHGQHVLLVSKDGKSWHSSLAGLLATKRRRIELEERLKQEWAMSPDDRYLLGIPEEAASCGVRL